MLHLASFWLPTQVESILSTNVKMFNLLFHSQIKVTSTSSSCGTLTILVLACSWMSILTHLLKFVRYGLVFYKICFLQNKSHTPTPLTDNERSWRDLGNSDHLPYLGSQLSAKMDIKNEIHHSSSLRKQRFDDQDPSLVQNTRSTRTTDHTIL